MPRIPHRILPAAQEARHLTKAQVCRRSGCTGTYFDRLVRERSIKVAGLNRNRQRLYDLSCLDEIDRLLKARGKYGAGMEHAKYTKEDAKAVHDCIKKRQSLTRISFELDLHPLVVRQISYDLADLDGALWLGKSDVDAINALPLDGPTPVRKPQDLIDVCRLASEEKMCPQCHERPIGYACGTCAEERAERKVRRLIEKEVRAEVEAKIREEMRQEMMRSEKELEAKLAAKAAEVAGSVLAEIAR